MHAILLAAVLCGQLEWIDPVEYNWIDEPSPVTESVKYENPKFDLSNPRLFVVESDCEPCLPELIRETDKLVGLGFDVYHQRPSSGRKGAGSADIRFRAGGRWHSEPFVSSRDFLDRFYLLDNPGKPSSPVGGAAPDKSGSSREQSGIAFYPVRGGIWSHPGSAAGHLLSGEHSGKFQSWYVNALSSSQRESLHSDDHEGRVKWQFVNKLTATSGSKPPATVAARPAVKQSARQSYCPTCPGYVAPARRGLFFNRG